MRAGAWLLAVGAAACGLPDPEAHVRVSGASPAGAGVPVDAIVEVRFTGPVDAEEIAGGARIVLALAAALPATLEAAESDAGAGRLVTAVPVDAALAEGGRRAVLVPRAPLRGRASYVVVVSSRLADRDGRPVLDSEGRRRASVFEFRTAAPPGPPPRPVLTETRVDAEAPEAGGEYVEVANLGDGALDLLGWRLVKRTASGSTASCPLEPAEEDAIPPGGVALVAGEAWDDRYGTPAGVPLLGCGTAALLGGLANDRPPELSLVDPDGAVVSTFGAGGVAPRCPEATVRLDPDGEDEASNLACAEGTPGWFP